MARAGLPGGWLTLALVLILLINVLFILPVLLFGGAGPTGDLRMLILFFAVVLSLFAAYFIYRRNSLLYNR